MNDEAAGATSAVLESRAISPWQPLVAAKEDDDDDYEYEDEDEESEDEDDDEEEE
jgi:hypothetical protein